MTETAKISREDLARLCAEGCGLKVESGDILGGKILPGGSRGNIGWQPVEWLLTWPGLPILIAEARKREWWSQTRRYPRIADVSENKEWNSVEFYKCPASQGQAFGDHGNEPLATALAFASLCDLGHRRFELEEE